ncbi:MAG: hypothetical protein LUC45_03900 [Paraprevotella sp.]|nr:hypothetical protein [Paraprevotella sp.]
MKRKTYVTPQMESLDLQGTTMFACSGERVDASEIGIGFGGNASDSGVVEAYANRNSDWDIW